MSQLTAELLTTLIGRIYEAAYDTDLWPIAVASIRDAFAASKACLVGLAHPSVLADVIAPDSDPSWNSLLFERHLPCDLSLAVSGLAAGTVYRDHDLVGSDRLHRSEIWSDWMQPQDMYGGLGCRLSYGKLSFFDVQRGRGQPDFDAVDEQAFRLLSPHILRAEALTRTLGTTRTLAAALDNATFGALLLGSDGRIVRMNPVAEAILADGNHNLSARAGRLVIADAPAAKRFASLLVRVTARRADAPPDEGGLLIVRSKEGRGPLVLSVAPLPGEGRQPSDTRRGAIVFIRRSRPEATAGFREHVAEFLGLTPKEAVLALALCGGLSLKEAAAAEGMRFSTARSHLENVFGKTGTRQQTQLVALIKGLEPIR